MNVRQLATLLNPKLAISHCKLILYNLMFFLYAKKMQLKQSKEMYVQNNMSSLIKTHFNINSSFSTYCA